MNRAPAFHCPPGARRAALGLAMLMGLPAYAVDVPRTTPTPDHMPVEEAHHHSLIALGAVAGVAAAAATAGVALLADSYVRYDVLLGGGNGNSCRPCTNSQMLTPRIEFGLSLGLLAASGVLAVVAGVLAVADHKHRPDHGRVSRVQLGPQGLRF